MKQMKFFLVALMAVMSVTFTSCLKGDDNNTWTLTIPVKYNYSSFLTGDGVKLIPTTDLGVLTGNMYLIACQYDQSQVTDATKEIPVTLLGTPVCIDPKNDEYLTTYKKEPTNPLYTLDKSQSSLIFYDKNTIFLTMPYWVEVKGNTLEDSEVNKHSFALSYNPEEISESDIKLVLNISHCVEEESEKVTRSGVTYAYRAYSISTALNQFKEKTGKLPQYLILKSQTNSVEDKLKTENGESTVEYVYPFKE